MIELTFLNRHWEKGFNYNFPKKRLLYEKIIPFLNKRFIISIVGLRRTGKTTIMKQIIDYLTKNINRKRILYYSFDEPAELKEVIENYLKISGYSVEDKLYMFLDEIQKVEDWQNKIKTYYDNYPNIKFIVSGSSSLHIRKKSESLAGRIVEFELEPLSFKEYLIFKEKEDWVNDQKLFANNLREEFEKYIFRQFIEIIDEDLETIKQYVESIIRKIIFEDIPFIYPVEQPQVLLRVMQIVANNPGMLLNYKNLSSDLNINEKTLSNYIEYMEKAYLLDKLYNFSKNLLTTEKKLKKVYLKTSSFCTTSFSNLNKLIENSVVIQLKSNFFWRQNFEVDCILVNDKEIIPLEVKYKDDIKQKDIKGIKKFIDKYDIAKGFILTRNLEKEEGNLKYIPVWKYLLNF